MKLSPDQQKMIILGVIVAALVVVVVPRVAPKPSAGKPGAAGPQIARLRADLGNVKHQMDHAEQIRQATAARHASIERLEARFVQGPAVDTLLADLSLMAKAAHVRIDSLEPMDVRQATAGSQGYYAEVPVQVWAKGGYHQLGTFIHALEQHQRLMRLVRLEITGNADEPWRQSAHIIVSTFRLMEPAGATP